jgi:hypothetical protein
MRRFLWLLCSFLLLLWADSGFAQGNDLSAPTGGRSALMGNTGVALGRDGSAPFYNPATIVRIRDERLAFSVNFYSLGLTHFADWHQPGEVDSDQFGDSDLGGTSLIESNFRSLPSTLCLFFTLEELANLGSKEDDEESDSKRPRGKKLAICFATLESEDVDQQAISFAGDTSAGVTNQVQSVQRRWSRTYVGPTYSVSLSDRLAIGGSVQVVYSYDSFGINSTSLSSREGGGGIASALGSSGSGRSFELTGLFGVTYRWDNFTLGASVRPPSLHILGSYDGTFNRSNSGDEDVSVIANATGSLKSAPPTRIAIGAGFAWERLSLEFDAAVGLPVQNVLTADLDVDTNTLSVDGVTRERTKENYVVSSHVTVNPSIGMEYFLNSSFSVLAGLSANFSALPKLDPVSSVGNLIQARTNHVNASLGVGSYWDGGELLFGVQLDYGFGQALAVNPYVLPNNWSVVDSKSYSLLFVIAGSTNLNAIVRVVTSIAGGGSGNSDTSETIQNPDARPLETDAEEEEQVKAPEPEPNAAPPDAAVSDGEAQPADAPDAGPADAATPSLTPP